MPYQHQLLDNNRTTEYQHEHVQEDDFDNEQYVEYLKTQIEIKLNTYFI